MIEGRKTTFEERMEIASYCISHDHNYAETSEKIKVSYQQARNYTIKYETGGVTALQDNRGKRKPEDTLTEVEKLRAELKLQKADYAQALLNCSVNRRMIAARPLAFGELGVKDRVKSVLNYKKNCFLDYYCRGYLSIASAVCLLTDPVSTEDKSSVREVTVPDQLYEQFLNGETAAYDNGQKKFLNEYLSNV